MNCTKTISLMVAGACALAVYGAKPVLRNFDMSSRSWEGGPPSKPGFYVRDARAKNARYVLLERGGDASSGLEFSYSSENRRNAEFFDVGLSDTTGKDRALTLAYVLPLSGEEVIWHADPRSNVVVRADMRILGNFYSVRDVGRRALSRHPFVAVSGKGMQPTAIGIDVEYPAFYRVAVDPGLNVAYIAWDVGFVKGKQSARFKFVRFGFDGKHGFRGALETYQSLYPANWEVRVKRQGSILSFTNASKIPDCEDFGFRFASSIKACMSAPLPGFFIHHKSGSS